MINVDYVPGVPNKTDGINIGLSVAQASRLRDLLLKYEVEGHVADDLRAGLFHALVAAQRAYDRK